MPIQSTRRKERLEEFVQYWIGKPKVGKTSIASRFPNPVFLFSENGGIDKSVPHWTPPGWDISKKGNYYITDPIDYDRAIADIACMAPDVRPKTVILDTIDGMYDVKAADLMRSKGVESLNDGALAYGRGGEIVRNWMVGVISALQQLGCGIIFISHMQERVQDKITKQGRETVTVYRDTLPDKVRPVVQGMVDFIWFFTQEGGARRIYTAGDITIDAGSRITLPRIIEMGKDADEAYRNILKAFGERDKKSEDTKETIIQKIETGEQYLVVNKIDGFEIPTRLANSRSKHLTNPNELGLNEVSVLAAYHKHLIEKYQEHKRKQEEKGE